MDENPKHAPMRRYRWELLNVGESFIVPAISADDQSRLPGRVRSAFWMWRRAAADRASIKVAVRQVENGVQVSRIA